MTEVNAINQQLLKQGYRRGQASKPYASVTGRQEQVKGRGLVKKGIGPAAILELSAEAKEIVTKKS